MTIYFENEIGYEFSFPIQEQLETLIRATVDYLKFPYEPEVSVSLVGRETIHRMNEQYRQVNRPTDVLSFPMMQYDGPADFDGMAFQSTLTVSPESGEVLLGDIVLCAEIMKSQAEEYGHSLLREFSFLVVHSMLHLLGYDHMEEKERLLMEQTQEDILQKLGIRR
ncbi:MAG: rRNA maturation RNase YbeY [Lachnospiraceae bacterium]|nr:rRNA maturation RNase YbeY [Lachnospiraceae bacterium]